jgi:acyl carrier protein
VTVIFGSKLQEGDNVNDALIQLFAETLQIDPAELNDNSSPDTVKQWDSLSAMRLVVAIEEKFNVRLSTKEIMKMSTIGRARQTLQSKKVAV